MRAPFNAYANKGFQITFENGYTVSVMFGAGNYCEHRYNQDVEPILGATVPVWNRHSSEDAEVAVLGPDDEFVLGWPGCPEGDEGDTVYRYAFQVRGWVTPADVLELMSWAAAQPAPEAT